MKKNTFTGNFTDKAGKTLVNSARFICELDGETVYCTNGYMLLKLSKPEYSMVIQPATHCDAGDYEIQNGERREHKPERRLAELLERYTAEPAAKPEPKTAAELIASRFADLAGVETTIKGAQTAAPVIWLTGDTKPHAEALKAAGAKWSGKRAAYYIRVA